MSTSRKCTKCGKTFVSELRIYEKQKFCGGECRDAERKARGLKIWKRCTTCGKMKLIADGRGMTPPQVCGCKS